MDEFNNNGSNHENDAFGEENFSGGSQPAQDPYNMPFDSGSSGDPFANRQSAANPQSGDYSGAQNPYGADYDPYKQPYQGQYNQQGQYQQYGQQGQYRQYNQQYGQYQSFGGYNVPVGGVYKTGLATASMVIGIISILASITFVNFIFPPLFLLPIVGIILGAVYKSKHYPVGRGTSTAGIVCSVIALVLSVAVLVIAVVLVMTKMPELMQILKDYSPETYEQYYEQFHDQYPQWFNSAAALFGVLFK
jgi:hypothetical protein